jgi:branched-chain amino acid transport system substrate-binding protein
MLYQNDDSGKDYLKGLKDALNGKMPLVTASYEPTDPTIDSQIVSLKGSGADILFIEATPKFASQAIRKSKELQWDGVRLLASISASVGSVLKPAGLDNSTGVISLNYLKDPTDVKYASDPAMKEWLTFLDKYFPDADRTSTFTVYGYLAAKTLVQVLKQCEDDLTRENIMKQAANLKDFELGLLLPGIKINTSAKDYFPLEQMQLKRFNGETFEDFGPVTSGELAIN